MATYVMTRFILNKLYLAKSPAGHRIFHSRYSKIFRGTRQGGRDGIWQLSFAGRCVSVPLAKETFWRDWDTAVSVLGHDYEVKEAYKDLIEGPSKPELFVDVGANYGTHSLLFLVHEIETLSFEPNPKCHQYFQCLCAANGITPNIAAIALGPEAGDIELSYPERETWLGSTDPQVVATLQRTHALKSERVVLQTLDQHIDQMMNKKTLIKIDTEGNEIAVLRGAEDVLRTVRPTVILESWRETGRGPIFECFTRHGYLLHALPAKLDPHLPCLTETDFLASEATNFIARPSPRSKAASDHASVPASTV